jgi:hypothetical protein
MVPITQGTVKESSFLDPEQDKFTINLVRTLVSNSEGTGSGPCDCAM